MDRPGVFPRGGVLPRRRGAYLLDLGAGDILAPMQGAITLDLIEERDLMDNAVERARQFTESMVDADYECVEDKRLMLAVTLDSKNRRDAVLEAAIRLGFLTPGCGAWSVRFLPRLAVTEREIVLAVEHLRAAIETTT